MLEAPHFADECRAAAACLTDGGLMPLAVTAAACLRMAANLQANAMMTDYGEDATLRC